MILIMIIVYSPECMEYEIPGHPESPDRIRNIHGILKSKGFKFEGAEPAGKEDILLVHSKEHFEMQLLPGIGKVNYGIRF